MAKLAIVLYFSDSISKKKDLMRTFRYGIAPYAIILIAVAGLVGLEPHLSGAMLILGAGAVLMLVGGIHWVWVGGAIGAAATMMYTVLFVIGYNTSRITYWLDPWKDAQGKGYQLGPEPSDHRLRRSSGRGSREEPTEVFVFAGRAQRFHLRHRLRGIGSYRRHSHHAALCGTDPPGLLDRPPCPGPVRQLDGGGHHHPGGTPDIFKHRRGNGFAAHTGISLPFFSYGGTALSIQLAEMGIVLSVSRQMKPTKAG